jgi:hypothetical protein
MFGEAGELRASMSSYGADFVQEADAGVPILDAKWSKVASRYDVFLIAWAISIGSHDLGEQISRHENHLNPYVDRITVDERLIVRNAPQHSGAG